MFLVEFTERCTLCKSTFYKKKKIASVTYSEMFCKIMVGLASLVQNLEQDFSKESLNCTSAQDVDNR